MRLGDKGTGFEPLLPPDGVKDIETRRRAEYRLETCEPGPYPFFYNSTLFMDEFCIGDLVLIHGSVLHKSERNTSPHTRFAYTFHMIESPPYAKYDEKNWLQPTLEMPFSRVLTS